MEPAVDPSWVAWGNIERSRGTIGRRQHGRRPRQTEDTNNSRFWRHWRAYNEIPCAVRMHLPHRNPDIHNLAQQTEVFEMFKDGDTALKVAFAGGSDTPHVRLLLKHIPTEQMATVAFSAWTREQPAEAAARVVPDYHFATSNIATDPVGRPSSFSMQLRNVQLRRPTNFPQTIIDRQPFNMVNARPLFMSWEVSQRPYGINLQVDQTDMLPSSRRLFNLFGQVIAASKIELYGRGNNAFWESWCFFAAQPSPTPPPWWRYTTKTEPNQLVMEDIPDISEGTELYRHHVNAGDSKIVPMVHNDKFMSPREYEVFIVGSLLREKDAQEKLYVDVWNHRYNFVLQDARKIASTVTSANSYVITMPVSLRPMAATDGDAPPPPDVRTEVFIEDRSGFEFKGTVVAVDPGNVVTMVVNKIKGTGAVALNERCGIFRFGNPGHPYVGAMKVIQMCMHRQTVPGHVPWLRTLLLAHENQSITPPVAPRVTGAWRQRFPTLNPGQEEALAQSCCRGLTLGERFNMIQGPPGTGKTTVIHQIAVNNLTLGRKFMAVAETRFAVQVIAAAISEAAETAGLRNSRVFLVEHAGAEGMEWDVEAPNEDDLGAPRSPDETADNDTSHLMSAASMTQVIHHLQNLQQAKVESLTTYINARIQILKDDPYSLPSEECTNLLQYMTIKDNLEDPFVTRENADLGHKAKKKMWNKIQEFYIKEHAMGVVVTAASSMTRILRAFRPEHIIIDEASQVAEHMAVPVLAKFFYTVNKVTIVGDPQQVGPYRSSLAELRRTTSNDLMSRMLTTGVPRTILTTQYRMHPHISALVSDMFYEGLLVDDGFVTQRPGDHLWHVLTQRFMPSCLGQHSIFLHVPPGNTYHTRIGLSMVNPRHVVVVREVVGLLQTVGVRNDRIAILTTYKAQLRLHDGTPNAAGINKGTVDGSQGREYDYVILDLVAHGGPGAALGFITDMKWVCVALSRAKHGLFIIGNREMGTTHHQNQVILQLRDIVTYHRENRALFVRNPPPAAVTNLMQTHSIPGTQYLLDEN